MKLEPGTIYFVREQETTGTGFTGLVKIGLVAGERSPYDRLKEHQTGNPRKLHFDAAQFVQTRAVKYVESQLHGRFAAKRVSGEWFTFASQDEIESAVAVTRELASSMDAFAEVFAEADRLNMCLSGGPLLAATSEVREIATRWVFADAIAQKAENLIDSISEEIKWQAREYGSDAVAGVLQTIETLQEPAFSVTAFKKANPKLWEELADSVPEAWNPKFEVSFESEPDTVTRQTLDALDQIGETVATAIEAGDVYQLNELDLEVRQILSPAEWERDVAEAQLKNFCGEAPGIDGICGWERRVKMRRKFDPEKLRLEYPATYQEFTLERRAKKTSIRLPFNRFHESVNGDTE